MNGSRCVMVQTEPYNYKPYFSVPNVLFDPAQVFTISEKIELVRHFITSPISEELNSDGTIDARCCLHAGQGLELRLSTL